MRTLFTAGLLALVLTACSSAAPSGGQPPGKLTVWFPGNSEAEMKLVKESIVPAFEKASGADVEVTYVDWAELSPKLNAAFAAGTAPDVIGHGVAATADLAANDRIEDLTPYVAKLEGRADLAAALPGGQVGGKQYIVPLIMTLRMIVYSGADFKAAGLDPEVPPETWQDVRAAAEKLTEREGDKIVKAGLVLPSNPIGIQQSYGTLLWSNGGEFLSPDGKKATLDTPQALASLEFFAGLYQGASAVDNTLGATWANSPPAEQPIVTGAAAMQLSNAGDIVKYQAAAPDRDLRLMPPPGFHGHGPRAFGGPANGLMINKDSRQKDTAWQFIAHMMGADTSLSYAEALGALPVRASSVDSPYIGQNAELRKAVEALPVNHANPNVPGWVRMRDAMGKSLEMALHGKLPAAEALKRATADVDKIIATGS
ncbi:ABC transporter substrate-binding protein [Nonomuraea soli]|uniref:Multiple sugar transport system substrate-binding protein n=1 Tax=Nonomuraea soli TaxID=1032476 RepID=A0A7W0CE00_9ACTN|nr:ABC transporter substrate-binding protein [Nonomuraea soli]MBA2889396.1 multiple sugar transport system substrate-binding protein [Nonomuraea soli]